MNHLYFAYGSNLWPPRLEQRLGPCERLGIARLTGYALRFHKRGADRSGKGDVFKTGDARDFVLGALYGLNDGQKQSLHGFEGPQYTARSVCVSQSDRLLDVFTYVARPQAIRPGLIPYSWYKAFVVQGAAYFEFPAEYRAGLESVSSLTDPDESRSLSNHRIIELSP